MRLQDIMSTHVRTVSPDTSAEEAYGLMKAQGIHHLPVVDGKNLVGVISHRDLGGTRGTATRKNRVVSELMSDDVVSAEPTMTLKRAANLLRGRSIGCLPVMEKGRLRGMITIADLLEQIGRGSTRPIERSVRWTLRGRGQRRKNPADALARQPHRV